MKMIRTILAKIRRADEKYHLIQAKDKIVVGISGGKDSMVLFYAMSIYSKFNRKKFKIIPVMLDLGFDHFDPTPIKEYIKSLGYELIIEDARNVYQILKDNQKEDKHLPCSICSRMKKACIDKVAKKLKANKVMFAHHADDAIETLFMNMIHGKRIATFSPKMHLSKDDITFIRPLIYVHENEIRRTINEENIPILPLICPSDRQTERENIKELLSEHIYKKYPICKDGFLEMLEDYVHLDIYYNKEDITIKNDLHMLPVYDVDTYLDYDLFFKKRHTRSHKEKGLSRYLIYKEHRLIGAFSSLLFNKTLIIYDFLLANDKYFKDILDFIIIFYKKKVVPLDVEVTTKKNRKQFIAYGFTYLEDGTLYLKV